MVSYNQVSGVVSLHMRLIITDKRAVAQISFSKQN